MPMNALNQVHFSLLPMSTSATVTANLTPSFTNLPFGNALLMTLCQPIYSGDSCRRQDDIRLSQSPKSTVLMMHLAMLPRLGKV